MIINLTINEPGTRLDKYVAEHAAGLGLKGLESLSRTRIQKLISDGHIEVNGRPARAGLKLCLGDRLIISLPSPAPTTLTPEAIPLKILYEDKDVVVIDKPSGLNVHPAPGHPTGTMVNALLSHLSDLPETGDRERPGVVHRLDKDTSGVMLVAKNAAAHSNLTEQFKSRSVSKTYLVLVKGRLTPRDGVIEAPIGRDSAHRQRMAVVAESRGREARTEYHVAEYLDGYTLLEVKPQTGRTHQIRVHLAAIGYPVVGDKVYGVRSAHLPRQFVHAYRLGFKLPSTGQPVEFTADLPPDLVQALKELRIR